MRVIKMMFDLAVIIAMAVIIRNLIKKLIRKLKER